MNKDNLRLFTYIIFTITILLVLRYYYSLNKKRIETFQNYSNSDEIFLDKCFSRKETNNFKKYHNVTNVIKTKNGMVFATPNKYIEGLQQISLNGIYLNNMCVDPKARNKGIGTQLVSSVINAAKKANYDHIILHVLKDNIPAIKIYQKLGFRKYIEGMNQDGKLTIIYVLYL